MTARAGEPKWKQHTINGQSEFEAAGVFDVDNDGKLDIVSRRHLVPGSRLEAVSCPRRRASGDLLQRLRHHAARRQRRRQDRFVTCLLLRQERGLGREPGQEPAAAWTYHEIDSPGTIEAAAMVDLNGDGMPDVLPNTVNVVVWYEVVKKADGKGFELKKHDFGTQAAGHGVGSGDVNGDGRVDLLTPKGWFEAPADPAHETWAWHPEWNSARPASRSSPATSTATACPTSSAAWATTTGSSGSSKARAPAASGPGPSDAIDRPIASVHTLLWADIDGDGKANELVTGKRVYAHEIEPGATDGSRDRLVRVRPRRQGLGQARDLPGRAGQERPRQGRPSAWRSRTFPPGTAGTGLQMTAIDIDGDGDLDLVCPGKSGLYLFENLGDRRSEYLGSGLRLDSEGPELSRESFDLFPCVREFVRE